MSPPSDKHLDESEIDFLISPPADCPDDLTGVEAQTAAQSEDIQAHLGHCEECNSKVQMLKKFQYDLSKLRSGGVGNPRESDCTETADWLNVAAGLEDCDKTKRLLSHAARCNRCGHMLRDALALLSDQPTREEASLLKHFEHDQGRWQTRPTFPAAKPPGGKIRKPRPFLLSGWVLAPLAGVIALVLLTFWLRIGKQNQVTAATQMIAQAYTEHRTIEMRFPGARYAAMQTTRGGASSSLQRPPSLLKAESLIGENIRQHPDDQAWLQAKARADLLDGNYESAVQSLRRARTAGPESPALLTDLGAAYFELAEAEDNKTSYAQAIDLLTKALDKAPDDPVALFNRAIAYEHDYRLYSNAINDWQHYLRVDPESEWTKEAKTRLANLQEKLRQHSLRTQRPPYSAPRFAEKFGTDPSGLRNEVDNNAELYQKTALEVWLPDAKVNSDRARSPLSPNQDLVSRSLKLLADALRQRHRDAWLSDFLFCTKSSTPSPGLTLLAKAIDANSLGHHDAAIQFAQNAARQFTKQNNFPGRVRAEYETVYSQHLAAQATSCKNGAKLLIHIAHLRHYSWIEIQALLEEAACTRELSKVDESLQAAQKALQIAKSVHYQGLQLRATVFVAGLLDDPEQTLRYLADGLTAYWSGNAEPMRGYSLYALTENTADQLHLWAFGRSVINEALTILASDPDTALRGMETFRLARTEFMLGDTTNAELHFRGAQLLLSNGQSPFTSTEASIYLADIYTQTGHIRQALDQLQQLQPILSTLSNDSIMGIFYTTRSRALTRSGQFAAAAEALVPALEIAERGLYSMSGERERFAWAQAFSPSYRAFVELNLSTHPDAAFRWWEGLKGASVRNPVHLNLASSTTANHLPSPIIPIFPAWPSTHTLLLSYAILSDGVTLWQYDGAKLKTTRLSISSAELTPLLSRFAQDCADPKSNIATLISHSNQLYNLLVKPAQPLLQNDSKLIIEVDGALQFIPFEALQDDHGKYLVESHEITYSPGIFYLAAVRKPSGVDANSRALVVGDPLSAQAGLTPLPDALTESREVAAHFRHSYLLLRQNATKTALLRDLPNAEIFHFAGHAVSGARLSGLGLSLADGEILAAPQLNTVTLLHARLVVLSACSTMIGPGGDFAFAERDNLARNLLGAGVPQIVASRWLVDSEVTRGWMQIFYRSLLANTSVAASARQSMLIIRSRPEYKHPFYWAAFSVFGKQTPNPI